MKILVKKIAISAIAVVLITGVAIVNITRNKETVQTSSNIEPAEIEKLSNKKIGWGLKRGNNNQQPDVGSTNKKILDKYEGIYMGNADKKYVYMTFDLGYEAGYTPKILEVLKQNNVKATFFITANYLNTEEKLVKQMIDEGHIVGNHTPKCLMSGNDIETKC